MSATDPGAGGDLAALRAGDVVHVRWLDESGYHHGRGQVARADGETFALRVELTGPDQRTRMPSLAFDSLVLGEQIERALRGAGVGDDTHDVHAVALDIAAHLRRVKLAAATATESVEEDADDDRPMTSAEQADHDAYYAGAGMNEQSHDAWAQSRGFNSAGEVHAWVDARLGSPHAVESPDLGAAGVREVIDALRNDMGPLGGLDRETLGDRLAGSFRSLVAATPREQGTAEAATGGDPRVDVLARRLCVSVEGGRDEARAMLARLDALAAAPRAEGEAAAGEHADGMPVHDPSVVSDRDAARIVENLCAEYGVEPGELVDTVNRDRIAAMALYSDAWGAPPPPEVVSDGDLVVEFIGSEHDRWHRWAVRSSEQAAAEVVRTLLPRVHAVRVHRGTCGGNGPKTERAS